MLSVSVMNLEENSFSFVILFNSTLGDDCLWGYISKCIIQNMKFHFPHAGDVLHGYDAADTSSPQLQTPGSGSP